MRLSVLLPNAFSARCSAEDPGGSMPLMPPIPVSPRLRGPAAACLGMAQRLAEPNADEKAARPPHGASPSVAKS